MKKILTIFILVLLCGCTSNISLKIDNDINSKEELLECIITVYTDKSSSFFGYSSNKYSLGTGIVISEDEDYYYALTCNHVIYSAYGKEDYYISNHNQEKIKAEVIKNDDKYDLALLKFKKERDFNVITLKSENESVGKTVFAIDSELQITEGTITNYAPGQKLRGAIFNTNVTFDVVECSTLCHPGSSGGPLVNEKNELVGIVYAMLELDGKFECCYAIPIEKVYEFIS